MGKVSKDIKIISAGLQKKTAIIFNIMANWKDDRQRILGKIQADSFLNIIAKYRLERTLICIYFIFFFSFIKDTFYVNVLIWTSPPLSSSCKSDSWNVGSRFKEWIKNPKIWWSPGERDSDLADPLFFDAFIWCSDSDCHPTATEKMCPTLPTLWDQEDKT